jgi:hypothetical protein
VVVVSMLITLEVKLVYGTTLWAAALLLLLKVEPKDVVRVSRRTGATNDALRVEREDLDRVRLRADTVRIERRLIEDLNALDLSEKLETLKTGRLIQVRGDFTGLTTGAEERWGRRTRTTDGSGRQSGGAERGSSGGTCSLECGARGGASGGAEGGGEHRRTG